jgi:hypothetical protein
VSQAKLTRIDGITRFYLDGVDISKDVLAVEIKAESSDRPSIKITYLADTLEVDVESFEEVKK